MTDKVLSKVKNKSRREKFYLYYSEHIINIKNRLESKNINLGKYNIFLITDPKCRVIMSQSIEDKIINCSYNILENIYRANTFQEIEYKKEIIVQIELLNFYLEEAYIKNILTEKKFINYTNHLIEIDKMVRSWIINEKNK
jgi:hypothetical protein